MHQDDLQSYDVSVTHGFLPTEPILRSLPSHYAQWDEIASALPELIQEHKLRDLITHLLPLPIAGLENTQQQRRAFVILGYMAHAYIWERAAPAHVPAFKDTVRFIY